MDSGSRVPAQWQRADSPSQLADLNAAADALLELLERFGVEEKHKVAHLLLVQSALHQKSGNKSQAATLLGIDRRKLYRLLDQMESVTLPWEDEQQ